MSPLISLKNVNKYFITNDKEYKILENFSLDIYPGDSLAITGPSGSGKSTALRIIGLLETPTSGEVIVGDTDYQKLSENTKDDLRRNLIGFVFQSYNLLPDFTVIENVMLPHIVLGNNSNLSYARARELLIEVNLIDKISSFPEQLSCGEQQRVAIARSLINRPQIVIADEPTGSLDFVNTQSVSAMLNQMSTKHNTTIVIVTHDIKVANRFNKIYSLIDGKLKLQSSSYGYPR